VKNVLNKMTQKVSEVKDSMMGVVENMLQLEKLTEKFSSISESTGNLYAQYTSELIALSPIIEEIGFRTTEIEFHLGIPPSFLFHFEKIKDTTPEKKQEILDLHKENRLLAPVVKMLMTADNFQGKIKLGGFKFRSVKINLGLTPGIILILIPKTRLLT
jgi:hypothetical protein